MPSRSRAGWPARRASGLVVHDAFGTAVVGDIDLATARAESCAEPGALPDVWPAPLRETRVRRDFSINAMAVALTGEPFGTLRDPLGGWADLVAGTVQGAARALVPGRSDADPARRPVRGPVPVRARRGDRRAGARGCPRRPRADGRRPAAARCAGAAAADGDTACAALALLESLGVLHAIAPGLHADAARFEELDELAVLAPDVDRGGPGSRCSSARCCRPSAAGCWSGSASAAADERVVASAAAAAADRLDDLPDEAALVVGGPAGRRWLETDRHVRLEIDGDVLATELGLAPGPEIGRLLRALLAEKRAGRLPDREAELRRAHALVA